MAGGTSRKSANQPCREHPESAPGLVTVTSFSVAGASAGDDRGQVRGVHEGHARRRDAAELTVAPARKLAPVIVTPVPPGGGPELGRDAETEGPGRGVGVGVGVRVGVGVGVRVGAIGVSASGSASAPPLKKSRCRSCRSAGVEMSWVCAPPSDQETK